MSLKELLHDFNFFAKPPGNWKQLHQIITAFDPKAYDYPSAVCVATIYDIFGP